MGRQVPKSATKQPSARRTARAVPDPDEIVKHEPLTWGYRFLDLGGEWGWNKLNPAHVERLHRELLEVEGQTLHSLLCNEKVKDIPIVHMKREARERLLARGFEEAEILYEIRVGYKKWRVWGLVERAVFLLLWWDEFETACHRVPKGAKRR